MNPGDIVLIRFPHTDLKAGKLRPALILAVTPGQHADLLLAMVSSRVYQAVSDFDEIIAPSDSDYPTTGLKAPFVIRLARIATVTPAIVNARLGHISSQRLQRVRHRLSTWLKSSN